VLKLHWLSHLSYIQPTKQRIGRHRPQPNTCDRYRMRSLITSISPPSLCVCLCVSCVWVFLPPRAPSRGRRPLCVSSGQSCVRGQGLLYLPPPVVVLELHWLSRLSYIQPTKQRSGRHRTRPNRCNCYRMRSLMTSISPPSLCACLCVCVCVCVCLSYLPVHRA